MANKALHRTAIPLRSIVVGDDDRAAQQRAIGVDALQAALAGTPFILVTGSTQSAEAG